MVEYQREIRKRLTKYGNFQGIIKNNGVLVIIDSAVSEPIRLMSKKYCRANNNKYGLSEAFFQVLVDRFERYAFILSEIKKLAILKIGSGGKGVSTFKDILGAKVREFVLLDFNKNDLIVSRNQTIIGDVREFPLDDKSFDVASSDVVEHIFKESRPFLYSIIKRVCGMKILITIHLQGNNCKFKGRTYDIAFQNFYEHMHNNKEFNTEQHIALIHLSPQEMINYLPNATISGYKNCIIWFKFMSFSFKPLLRFRSGLFYYLFWKKDNQLKPFRGATIALEMT